MSIVAFISLLILAAGEGFDYSSSSLAVHKVPDFSIEDLQSGRRDEALNNVLTTTGLLAVRIPIEAGSGSGDVNPIYGAKQLLSGLCDCRTRISDIPGGQSALLLDGKTTRSTIATTTFGSDAPLSLPTRDIDFHCARGLTKKLEDARYQASRASNAFVLALDRLLLSWGSQAILSVKKGENYKTLASVIDDAKHLEHFHVYSKHGLQGNHEENESDFEVIDKALDWHTDAGLFLAFLPAVSCTDLDKPDNSFRIRIPTIGKKNEIDLGEEMQAIFPDEKNGEIVVALMLGAGAENWLHTPTALQLRAARHAVRMSAGEERAWYGKMHLVPEEAIIEQMPEPRTFDEMKKSVATNRYGNMDKNNEQSGTTIGCGNSFSQILSLSSHDGSNHNHNDHISANQRDRLLTVAGDCTNSTNLFCWMGCRDTADNGVSFDENVKSGKSIYCLDPGTLSATDDLQKAVDACTNPMTKIVGGMHTNKNCTNSWNDAVDGVFTHLSQEESIIQVESLAFKKSWGVSPTIFASMFLMIMGFAF